MAGVLTQPAELSDYMRAARRSPFQWGRCDCFVWACDWIKARRGVDPAAQYRGRYRTALGAHRHIARAGGWENLVRERFAACGLEPTAAPKQGDVGLVIISGTACLAIRQGEGWAGKSQQGIAWSREAILIEAWSI